MAQLRKNMKTTKTQEYSYNRYIPSIAYLSDVNSWVLSFSSFFDWWQLWLPIDENKKKRLGKSC